MGLETLSLAVRVLPLLHLFSPHLSLEPVLWEPTVEVFPAFLAKLEAMTMIAQMPLDCLTLEQVSHWSPSFFSASLLLFCFLSSYNLGRLPS